MLTVEYRYVPNSNTNSGTSCWGVTDLETERFYPFGTKEGSEKAVNCYTPTEMETNFSSFYLPTKNLKFMIPEEPEEVVLPVRHGRKFKNIFL
jgi:hypothetical protein